MFASRWRLVNSPFVNILRGIVRQTFTGNHKWHEALQLRCWVGYWFPDEKDFLHNEESKTEVFAYIYKELDSGLGWIEF